MSHPKYRADIDGLRALAILSVVGFHAFPKEIPGGFVGVDIFFVISGFLISTIIFSDLDKGVFSFRAFYSRRIRRIFPALLLVFIACYVFGWFALLAGEFKQLGKHIAGGAGFLSNFILWNESGYFDSAAETKPLLHLWSLGIEEQFYVVWPLLLYLAYRRQLNLLIITLLVVVISFAFNIGKIDTDSIAAFYSPTSRFWELMIGCALAYLTIYKSDWPEKVKQWIAARPVGIIYGRLLDSGTAMRNAQSITGFALIVSAIFALDKGKLFPGWWALLPTIGAFLIVSAGPKAWLNHVLLSNRVLVWFGLISFPLYLWHWPLLSFVRIIEGAIPSPEIRITAILISVLLAWLTYKLIEKPIRFGSHEKTKTTILCGLMVAIGYVGFQAEKENGYANRFENRVLEKENYLKSWQYNGACTNVFSDFFLPQFNTDRDFCHWEDKNVPPDVVVFGDSHANRLYLGLKAIDSKHHYINMGRGTCLPFLGVEGKSGEHDYNCQPTMENLLEQTLQSRAGTVFITAMFTQYFDGTVQTKTEDLTKNIEITLEKLNNSGKRVVVVFDVPILPFSPDVCKIRPLRITPQPECKFPREVHEKNSSPYKKILLSTIVKYKNISYFDPSEVLCDSDYCYGANAASLLYNDDNHVNIEGARLVARQLLDHVGR